MYKLDLNCDLGESFGAYTIGNDSQIMPFITSANIACGYHAGDALVMNSTVAACKQHGVAIGAHPGLPDLMGFGRRNIAISAKEAAGYVTYQLGALNAFCKLHGVAMQHVKPHGALYNMAAADKKLARAICEAIAGFDEKLILLALSGSQMIDAANETGVRCACEVFADRAYENDGSLVQRSKPGAMIENEDEAVARVIKMIKSGTVTAIDGSEIAINAHSVCVHGDSPKALEFVEKIKAKLEENKIKTTPLADVV